MTPGKWTLFILVVPVVYLLSVPPIGALAGRVDPGAATYPAWFKWYQRPYLWLWFNTPLEEPLGRYRRWWKN